MNLLEEKFTSLIDILHNKFFFYSPFLFQLEIIWVRTKPYIKEDLTVTSKE